MNYNWFIDRTSEDGFPDDIAVLIGKHNFKFDHNDVSKVTLIEARIIQRST